MPASRAAQPAQDRLPGRLAPACALAVRLFEKTDPGVFEEVQPSWPQPRGRPWTCQRLKNTPVLGPTQERPHLLPPRLGVQEATSERSLQNAGPTTISLASPPPLL